MSGAYGSVRGGGYGGGGGGRGGGREGDWTCPDRSCGNVNFARRTECNKCGAPNPAGGGGGGGGGGGSYSRDGGGGDYNGGSRSNYGAGRYDGNRRGGSGSRGYGGGSYDEGRGGSGGYGGSRGGSYGEDDKGNYSQVPPPAIPSYGGPSAIYPPNPSSFSRNNPHGGTDSVPPPIKNEAPNSLPPTYGASPPNPYDDARVGRGGPPANNSGYGNRAPQGRDFTGALPRHGGNGYNGYEDPPVEPMAAVKQCDENCGGSCDNSRIYISNLPPDVTTEELRELFGGIGQVARIKQKRGYKDQWPWNIKIYTDEAGNNKGDAVLSYEDPSAAHSAGGFYNNYDMRGHKITVAMAEKTALKAPQSHGYGGGGRGGGYGGGGARRGDNYRDRGRSGPDRHSNGGQRSRPY